MRTGVRRVLLSLATVLLTLGAVAGVANREIIDGSRFADHVDSIRMDDNVAQVLGVAITNKVLAVDPNLVALRPAIEAVSVALVRSSVFTPVVERAAREVHEAFTNPSTNPVVFRLADLTAVLVAALRTVAPNAAANLPPGLDVQLAALGGHTPSAQAVHATRVVGLLSWLLPLLGLIALVAAIWVSRRRQRTLAVGGLAVTGAGAAVALIIWIIGLFVDRADDTQLSGALIVASWHELEPELWDSATILAASGLIIFAAAGALLPRLSIAALERRAVAWVRDPGESPRRQVVAALVLIGLAVLALIKPMATARIMVELVALAVLAEGVARLSRLANQGKVLDEQANAPRTAPAHTRWIPWAIVTVTVLALITSIIYAALPTTSRVALARPPVSRTACNGHDELCSRPYDEVAYVSTHNSMSAADEHGWFIPEQPTGVVGQLNDGVRSLLIDTWYGQQTERPGIIANIEENRSDALAQAQAEYGAQVVESALRVRSALNLTPHGPIEPYLCHALCELGSTLWLPVMQGVKTWLDQNPREVITFIIEDSVSPADTAKVFDEAGLLPFVYTKPDGQPWPTLGSMIDSGRRVVVFMQRQGGGATYPWLKRAWDYIQDTPYDTPTQASLSCALLRGNPDNSLLLINNFINQFSTRVTDSAKLNALDALGPYVNRCKAERGQLPNFIAVDFYDQGDVFDVVAELNGVT